MMGWHNWLRVIVVTILSCGGSAAIEYALTGGSSGWIPVIAGVVSGIVTLFVVLLMERRQPAVQVAEPPGSVVQVAEPQGSTVQTVVVQEGSTVQNLELHGDTAQSAEQRGQAEQPQREIDNRIFSRRTPEELVSEIEGHTDIAAKKISRRHNW